MIEMLADIVIMVTVVIIIAMIIVWIVKVAKAFEMVVVGV